MVVLRCDRVAAGDVDRAFAGIGPATLARRPDGRFITVPDIAAANAVRALAFAGVRAAVVPTTLEPSSGTRPAVGRDLAPLPLAVLALDLVHVRPLPLGSETARLLRRRPFGAATVSSRALCRDLLHGVDGCFGWRRRAWSTRDALRSAEVRRSLRPVIFDVSAVAAPPEHRAFFGQAALATWLFG